MCRKVVSHCQQVKSGFSLPTGKTWFLIAQSVEKWFLTAQQVKKVVLIAQQVKSGCSLLNM